MYCFFFASRRRHTRCALVTGVQTCALPISVGGIPDRVGPVPDERKVFTEALRDQLVRADLVVTSGGVSEGDYDVVKESLKSVGHVWFGGVAMQPGKPPGFGLIVDERTPISPLPGNPLPP